MAQEPRRLITLGIIYLPTFTFPTRPRPEKDSEALALPNGPASVQGKRTGSDANTKSPFAWITQLAHLPRMSKDVTQKPSQHLFPL